MLQSDIMKKRDVEGVFDYDLTIIISIMDLTAIYLSLDKLRKYCIFATNYGRRVRLKRHICSIAV